MLKSATSFPYSAGSVLLIYYYSFFLDSLTTIVHIYTTRSNNNTQGSSMTHKKGKSTNFCHHDKTVSMESSFERLERHDDRAHSDETSQEKLVLPKRMPKMEPLLRIASVDQLEHSRLQIFVATSLHSERFFSSACWRKNGFCSAQEDQEQVQQLARTQRAPPQQRLIFSPLALTLSRSDVCHHDTNAHWCL